MPELPHSLAENVNLRLRPLFPPVFHRRSGLPFQRKFHASCLQNFIDRFQEREHPSNTQIRGRLIGDFLHLYRRHAEIQRGGNHCPEFVDPLTAQERRQNRKKTGLIVQSLSRLVQHLVKGEVVKALNELRVRLQKFGDIAGKHLLMVRFRKLGNCHFILPVSPRYSVTSVDAASSVWVL